MKSFIAFLSSSHSHSLNVASEQLHDAKLRSELTEEQIQTLEKIVSIMLKGDPTLQESLKPSGASASQLDESEPG